MCSSGAAPGPGWGDGLPGLPVLAGRITENQIAAHVRAGATQHLKYVVVAPLVGVRRDRQVAMLGAGELMPQVALRTHVVQRIRQAIPPAIARRRRHGPSGGREVGARALGALCANGSRQNASLRPLVEARGGDWEDLPADTFKEEGTGVRVALITLQV